MQGSDDYQIVELTNQFYKITRSGDYDGALQIQEQMLELAGSDENNIYFFYARILYAEWFQQQQEFIKSNQILDEVIEKARILDFPEPEAIALLYKARNLNTIYENEEIPELLQRASHIAQQLDNDRIIMLYNQTKGGHLHLIANFSEALEYHLLAQKQIERQIELHGDFRDEILLNSSYNSIALIFTELDNLDDALRYYSKALQNSRRIGDSFSVSRALNNINILYSKMGDFQTANDSLMVSLELNRASGRTVNVIRNLYNIGDNKLDMGLYSEALDFFNEALQESIEIDLKPGIMFNTFGIGKAYFKMGKEYWPTAKTYLIDAEVYATNLNDRAILYQTYKTLYEIEKYNQNYILALEYHEKFKEYAVLYFELARNQALDDLMIKHRVETTRAENQFLSERLLLEESANKNKAVLIVLLVFLSAIAFIFATYFFRIKSKLEEANNFLQEQKLSISTKNDTLKRLSKERNAFLHVIVHDLRNPLSAIDGALQLLKFYKESPGKVSVSSIEKDSDELMNIIDNSSKRMNLLIFSLLNIFENEQIDIHKEMEPLPISDILRKTIEEYEPIARVKDITFKSELNGINGLSHRTSLEGIFSNLISNAIKYSQRKTDIYISLREQKMGWEFLIRDQGQGFSAKDHKNMFKLFGRLSATPTANESSTGIGLYSVKTSVDRLSGTIKVNQDYTNGAEFNIFIPWPANISEKEEASGMPKSFSTEFV